MTRKEKIEFINEVKAGNFAVIKEIKKEAQLPHLIFEYFYPCFFYLCENDSIRPPFERYGFKIQITTLPELKEGLEAYMETGTWTKITDRGLDAVIEIGETIEILYDRNELHILEQYKK